MSFNNSFDLPPGVDFQEQSTKTTVLAGSDPLVKSDFVYQLTPCSFNTFLEKRDAVLVLFYDEEMRNKASDKNQVAKKNFIQAAENTLRAHSAFATVDCVKSPTVCTGEEICKRPVFKLYTKGILIGTVHDPFTFTSNAMKDFVNNAPVLKEGCGGKR